jgi:hypothetical protein
MKHFFLTLLAVGSLAFCGTISSWTDHFFQASSDEERLDALKFIHCQPIIDSFNGGSEDLKRLDSLLTTALKNREEIISSDKYVINLVFKNYVRFDLEEYEGLAITSSLAKEIALTDKDLQKIIRNIPKEAPVRKANHLDLPHEEYAKQIAQEIDIIYN